MKIKLDKIQLKLLATGGYAKKQIFSKSILMSYAHRKRFEFVLKLMKKLRPKELLDYGCGDGTFLIYCKYAVSKKVGYDLSTKALSENKERLKDYPEFEFLLEKKIKQQSEQYDVITCMEVLEHCTADTIEMLKADFLRLLRPDGTLIVSVPIETGGAVLVKQAVRFLLGLVKFGTYEHTEYYSWKNFFKMMFANEKQSVQRLYYSVGGYTTCGHYAFNWKALKKNLESNFEIEKTCFTPFPFLMGILNSQVWFICKPKKNS